MAVRDTDAWLYRLGSEADWFPAAIIGFFIALWLIWVGLRWIIEKIAAAFRKK
jgi:hypothetical protein